MKKLSLIIILILGINSAHSQVNNPYQKGLSAQKNLDAIIKLAPFSDGAVGFDSRYEGVKGTTRLFDELLPSFLKVKGNDYYLELGTDIDVVNDILLFTHPKTGKLTSIPSDIVAEVILKSKGKDFIFRTSSGKRFDKEIKGNKFYQVLRDGNFQFIKMPVKTFTEADYKGAYSTDRRYDEYETKYRYYISGNDDTFHQLKLNRKSLVKLFPDKKELISKIIDSKSYSNDEEMVISILDKF